MIMRLDRTLNDIETIDSFDGIDWSLKAIKADKVWDKTMGEGVTIVTMDTGVDITHPDLSHNIKSTFNMIDKSLDVTDEYGHGTHVAGLLVGELTGVAPLAELHAIKVLNGDGMGSVVNIMDGITHAMNLKADVLSISLGVPYNIPLILKQRIADAYSAGVTIISAVGNSGASEPQYPAKLDEVIGVGGIDKRLQLTSFTNMGYDVLAPSTEVLSTYKDNNYARMTGTSMASPLVAGVIALLISYYRKQGKELKPWEIKAMLQGKVLDLTDLIG